MKEIAELFIAESRSYLASNYLPKLERSLAALSDEDIWWRPNEASNSIGNLLLHLDGSTRYWIITVAGGIHAERDRQREFDERDEIPGAKLLAQLAGTIAEADDLLARINGESLLERRQSKWKELTALQAIYHAVEHFSMHTGQIIMLAKMRAGKDLKLSG